MSFHVLFREFIRTRNGEATRPGSSNSCYNNDSESSNWSYTKDSDSSYTSADFDAFLEQLSLASDLPPIDTILEENNNSMLQHELGIRRMPAGFFYREIETYGRLATSNSASWRMNPGSIDVVETANQENVDRSLTHLAFLDETHYQREDPVSFFAGSYLPSVGSGLDDDESAPSYVSSGVIELASDISSIVSYPSSTSTNNRLAMHRYEWNPDFPGNSASLDHHSIEEISESAADLRARLEAARSALFEAHSPSISSGSTLFDTAWDTLVHWVSGHASRNHVSRNPVIEDSSESDSDLAFSFATSDDAFLVAPSNRRNRLSSSGRSLFTMVRRVFIRTP